MTLNKFINEHRKELTEYIKKKVPNSRSMNDRERELWILNDEPLYHWARSEGVKI